MAVLWFTGLPCKRMLAKCSWKNVEVNCGEIFKLVPTDIGFCCSFNHLPLNYKLRNSSFGSVLQTLERRYKSYYDEGGSAEVSSEIPPVTPQAGKQNGLRVLVDLKATDLTPASVTEDFNGIQALVANRDNFPVMISQSFLISPGRETQVEISAQRSSVTKDLKSSVEPELRNCYFDDEFYLKTFSAYTMTNCWVECLINLSRRDTNENCIPWNFPSVDEPACDPMEQFRFIRTYRSLDMTKVIGTELCLPNCAETVYSVSVTSAPFRDCDQANLGLSPQCAIDLGPNAIKPHKWAEIVEAAYGGIVPQYLDGKLISAERDCPPKFKGLTVEGSRQKYNAFEDDLAGVLFYFNKPYATELVSAPTMTWTIYFSRVGGIFGLFIGFSLISGIEIIYWLTIGWLENAFEDRSIAKKLSKKRKISSSVRPYQKNAAFQQGLRY